MSDSTRCLVTFLIITGRASYTGDLLIRSVECEMWLQVNARHREGYNCFLADAVHVEESEFHCVIVTKVSCSHDDDRLTHRDQSNRGEYFNRTMGTFQAEQISAQNAMLRSQ